MTISAITPHLPTSLSCGVAINVIPLGRKAGIFGVLEKEIHFWKEKNRKNPEKVVCQDDISSSVSSVNFQGTNLIAYACGETGYVKKVSGKLDDNPRRFAAKDDQISLGVDYDADGVNSDRHPEIAVAFKQAFVL